MTTKVAMSGDTGLVTEILIKITSETVGDNIVFMSKYALKLSLVHMFSIVSMKDL
jgi:hypothetical protein